MRLALLFKALKWSGAAQLQTWCGEWKGLREEGSVVMMKLRRET